MDKFLLYNLVMAIILIVVGLVSAGEFFILMNVDDKIIVLVFITAP